MVCLFTNEDILGLKYNVSQDEIKKVYRTLAQQYHPDKNADPQAQKKFIEIKQYCFCDCRAYETLTDEDKRREWDN